MKRIVFVLVFTMLASIALVSCTTGIRVEEDCPLAFDTLPVSPESSVKIPKVPSADCDSVTECCIHLCEGVNFISLPLKDCNIPPTTTLRDLIPNYRYHSGVGRIWHIKWYDPLSSPHWKIATTGLLTRYQASRGYRIYSNAETDYCMVGIPVQTWSDTIYSRWNLIGSVLCDTCPCCCGQAQVGIPFAEPCVRLFDDDYNPIPLPGNIKGPYEWDCVSQSWKLTTIIKPFKAYAVKLKNHDIAILTMSCCRELVDLDVKPCGQPFCYDTLILTACECDSFAPPTESPAPSQALIAWIDANYNPNNNTFNPPNPTGASRLRDCDETTTNRFWAHTFTGLKPKPCCRIESATLTIRVRNNDYAFKNDDLRLGFISGSNDPWPWSNRLNLLDPPVLEGHTKTITLDLSDVDASGINLLDDIETNGFLDVTVQDDSPVDCATLTIIYGPCP